MKIVICHDQVDDNSKPDAYDVVNQANAIHDALTQLGHSSIIKPCSLNSEELRMYFEKNRPDMVFNLVESLNQQGRFIHFVPNLLESLHIPFTGNKAYPMLLTSNKIMAKNHMLANDLPTPPFIGPYPFDVPNFNQTPFRRNQYKWLIKSVWEHASIGLNDNELIAENQTDLIEHNLIDKAKRIGGPCYAEAYIEGREFNISMIASNNFTPILLPISEIVFVDYAPGKPKILGYSAKWHEDSFEYKHTVRNYNFDPKDNDLLEHLKDIAKKCWYAFGLQGYARVDFRVDNLQNPFILEINANPCISPDSGFAAGLEIAKISYLDAIKSLVDNAYKAYKLEMATDNLSLKLADSHYKSADPSVLLSDEINVRFRYEVRQNDREQIEKLLEKTKFFYPEEIKVALELVDEAINQSETTTYNFIISEYCNRIVGYSCYGLIPCTLSGFDIYWIAVHPDYQKHKLGTSILHETEKRILKKGGTNIYVETSQRPRYIPTRAFYEKRGYSKASLVPNFYAQGDGKIIYYKELQHWNDDEKI